MGNDSRSILYYTSSVIYVKFSLQKTSKETQRRKGTKNHIILCVFASLCFNHSYFS